MAAQDALMQGIINAISDLNADLKYIWRGPGLSAIATAQVTLSTTVTPVFKSQSRVFCEIKNTDLSISIYLGGPTVSSTTGHLVKAGEAFDLERFGGDLYAVAASGTPVISWIAW